MRVVFLNRFYWPETPATGQLLADLAEGLAARGWAVTVLTSAAHREVLRRETHRGVRIVRVAGTRWARLGALGKTVDFATFYLGAIGQLLLTTRRDDLVVAMTDPPMLGLGVWLSARLRRARVVHWIQDIYPEVAIELLGQRWLRALRPLRDLFWRHSDLCVTVGSDMATTLTTSGVAPTRTAVVPNWAPAGLAVSKGTAATALREEWGLAANFVVAYAGNLGRVHDLEPVLALAGLLRDAPAISFLFVGDGPQRAALEAAVRQHDLSNVIFRPPQPRARLAEVLAVGDLHLVTLRTGCESYVFPSKLYGIAAIGRPVLFIGPPDCEIARLVRDCSLGWTATRDEVATLAANIRQCAREAPASAPPCAAALRFAEQHAASVAIDRWHELLLATVGSGRSTTGRATPSPH